MQADLRRVPRGTAREDLLFGVHKVRFERTDFVNARHDEASRNNEKQVAEPRKHNG